MMVFGQSKLGEIQLDEEGKAFCIFVGKIHQEQENRFHLMKSSVLASKLDEDGSPVSKDSIIAAIRKLHKLSKKQFGTDARVVSLRSADTKKREKWGLSRASVPELCAVLGGSGAVAEGFRH